MLSLFSESTAIIHNTDASYSTTLQQNVGDGIDQLNYTRMIIGMVVAIVIIIAQMIGLVFMCWRSSKCYKKLAEITSSSSPIVRTHDIGIPGF